MIKASSIPLSLYIHFPWCTQKCPYCDFNSHTLRTPIDEAGYLGSLIEDATQQAPWAYAATQSTSGSNHEERLIRETVTQDARLKGEKVTEQVSQIATESPKEGRPRPVSAIAQELEDWFKDYRSE